VRGSAPWHDWRRNESALDASPLPRRTSRTVTYEGLNDSVKADDGRKYFVDTNILIYAMIAQPG